MSYFHIEEMRCRDGTSYPERWALRWGRLRALLDTIRGDWGAPIVIVSGYRTPEHNTKVGGAKRSQHLFGRAADIRPGGKRKPGDVDRLYELIVRMYDAGRLPDLGALGAYSKWVHLDTRLLGVNRTLVRWDKRRGDLVA